MLRPVEPMRAASASCGPSSTSSRTIRTPSGGTANWTSWSRELASAYGLGKRPRRAGDPVEKARSTVTWRIRHAIRRIGELHPAVGTHLKHAVRTGRYCVYQPDDEVRWIR